MIGHGLSGVTERRALEASITMKTYEIERRVLDYLWPLRPFDAVIVGMSAILLPLFGTVESQADRWLWWWAGTTVGLIIVLARVRHRVRAASPPEE
jgi:hypothetical protein